jgi:hypothetical protein
MTHHLIQAGEIAAGDLQNLTDSELMGIISISRDAAVREMYRLFRQRELYREAIVLRPSSFAARNNKNEKPITTFGITAAEIKKLVTAPQFQIQNQAGLTDAENTIAALAGLRQHAVTIVPITNPERFIAQDIMVYRGRHQKPASLKAQYPAHFKDIEEIAQTYVAFRVCTIAKHRKELSAPKTARKIKQWLLGV